jgi:sporulation protein YqfC
MSSWKQRLSHRATEWLGLPPDALLDVSRVTCLDGHKVIVENAVELLRVSGSLIEVELTGQRLTIEGQEFVVTMVMSREIHIEGIVHSMTYQTVGGQNQ